jgi:APA family basic amino acid/polyamine antiporter
MRGDRIPATILICYIVLGALIYIGYGLSHSRLAKGLDLLDDGFLPTPMEAAAHGIHER